MPKKHVQRCLRDGWMSTIPIPSNSDPDQVYEVLVQIPDDPDEAICECEGFRFRGSCVHQDQAIDAVCGWMTGDEPRQTIQERAGMQCPACGGPTEWTTVDV